MNGQPQNTSPLTALSPDERTRALERYRILQPCVETGVPLTHIARDHGMSLRTAQRWLAQYRRYGLAGLARRERSDRGHRHGLQPELKPLIEGLALRKPLGFRRRRRVTARCQGQDHPPFSSSFVLPGPNHPIRASLRPMFL